MNAPFPHLGLPIPLWRDPRLSNYLGELNDRHNAVDYVAMPNIRDLTTIRVSHIFINPLLAQQPVSPSTDPQKWPEGVGFYDALEKSRALVVLGDPGSGKTTLANWLTWRLSTLPGYPLPAFLEDRVPISCVLREMKSDMFGDNIGIPELLDWTIRRVLGDEPNARSVACLHAWVAAKRYVLILDGIDEIAHSHRAVVAKWIKQVVADEAIVLATGRIVGYEEYPVDRMPCDGVAGLGAEMMAGLGGLGRIGFMGAQKIDPDNPPWATCMYLMPFGDRQINDFIRCWYSQRGGGGKRIDDQTHDLIKAIQASKDILELARTPNLLSLMAIVHRERANLPNGRALLFKEIANAYINTIDQQRKISPGDVLARYPVEMREGWIAYIGFHMQTLRVAGNGEGDSGILVAKAQVLQWLTAAMQNSNMPEAAIYAEEFLSWVARRSGLLLPRGEDWYAFAHLSFQEYFCARFLMAQVTSPAFIRGAKGKNLLVSKDELAQYSEHALWRETLIYLLELVCNERGVDWLQEVLEVVFGELREDKNFTLAQGNLVAKVLTDQHIYLDADYKRDLARQTGVNTLPETLDDLCQAGFAINIIGTAAQPAVATSLVLPANTLVENVFLARLENLQLQDLAALARLPQLHSLVLDNCDIADLSALGGLAQVRYLQIYYVSCATLKAITNMQQLELLALVGVKVQDITPLLKLKKLEGLALLDCKVTDFTPLAKLANLQSLLLNKAQKKAGKKLKKQRPDMVISYG